MTVISTGRGICCRRLDGRPAGSGGPEGAAPTLDLRSLRPPILTLGDPRLRARGPARGQLRQVPARAARRPAPTRCVPRPVWVSLQPRRRGPAGRASSRSKVSLHELVNPRIDARPGRPRPGGLPVHPRLRGLRDAPGEGLGGRPEPLRSRPSGRPAPASWRGPCSTSSTIWPASSTSTTWSPSKSSAIVQPDRAGRGRRAGPGTPALADGPRAARQHGLLRQRAVRAAHLRTPGTSPPCTGRERSPRNAVDLRAVVTAPARPAGRRAEPRPTPVARRPRPRASRSTPTSLRRDDALEALERRGPTSSCWPTTAASSLRRCWRYPFTAP